MNRTEGIDFSGAIGGFSRGESTGTCACGSHSVKRALRQVASWTAQSSAFKTNITSRDDIGLNRLTDYQQDKKASQSAII